MVYMCCRVESTHFLNFHTFKIFINDIKSYYSKNDFEAKELHSFKYTFLMEYFT